MVTILLATYNGEKYLGELLDSLLRQTHRDMEIIVRDDCSEDATPTIIAEYQAEFADKIRVLDSAEPSGSATGNFFELMGADGLRGEYFMFCDQDDVWMPDKVEKTLALMEKTQAGSADKPVLVHTDLIVADDNLNEIARSFIRYQGLHPSRCKLGHLLVQNNITGCAMMINRKLLELALSAGDTMDIMMHDWWIGIIASALGTIAFLDSPTVLYRQHCKNEVGAINIHSLDYVIRTVKKARAPKNGPAASALQAEKFQECFSELLKPEQKEMINAFAHLSEMSRGARLRARLRYRFFMQRRMMTVLLIFYNILFG